MYDRFLNIFSCVNYNFFYVMWSFSSSFLNFFSSVDFFLFVSLFSFYFIFLNFLKSNTAFFKILFMLLCIVNCCLIISFCGGDFFAGFLVAAELPIVLISLLFYFHKYSLQVDHVFSLNLRVAKTGLPLSIFFLLGFVADFFGFLFIDSPRTDVSFFNLVHSVISVGFTQFSTFYDFVLPQTISSSTRNDFYLYYSIYYNVNYLLVLLFGVFLFLVSVVCIFSFFSFKWLSKTAAQKKKNMVFVRKQSMLRQGVFSSKLKFFKKK